MQAISDVFAQFGSWLWFALSVLLFVLETIVPGVHFLWFGLAAGIIGVLSLAVPMAWTWQVILFSLIAFVTVFIVRRSGSGDIAKTDEPALNVRGAQYIGRTVVVEDAIRNGRGRVRIGDSVWAVEGEDAPLGARVEVTGVNGTVLVVTNSDAE